MQQRSAMESASQRHWPGGRSALERGALALLLCTSVALVASFLAVSVLRMSYRFELEWHEGLIVDYAWRIAHGLPIYGPPDRTFAANLYPPLYYFIVLPALVAAGWTLGAARFVSWTAAVGSGLVTVWVLRRERVSMAAVVVALGIEAAFYPVTLHWYDLARVDSVQTFFALAGLATLAGAGVRPGFRRIVAGGIFLVLSIFTKQISVWLCAASVGYFAFARDWRRCAQLAAVLVVFGLIGAAALVAWSPEALRYIVVTPLGHRLSLETGLIRIEDFAWRLVPFVALGLCALFGNGADARPVRFFLFNLAGAIVASFLTLLKMGGQTNSGMPAIFLLGIVAGFGAEHVWRLLEGSRGRRSLRAALAAGFAGFLVLASGGDYFSAVPTREGRQVAEELWQDMAGQPGPFLAYNHSFVSTVLRGETYPSADALYDYAGAYAAATFRQPDVSRYPRDFLGDIAAGRFSAIYTAGSYAGDPVNLVIALNYRAVKTYGSSREDSPRWARCLPGTKWAPRRPARPSATSDLQAPRPPGSARSAQ
jgi:hypothetical protein